MAKVTSKTVTNETTGIRTTTYSDGRIVIDTPNKAKGGYDRVDTVKGEKPVSSWIAPRLKMGGNAKEHLGVVPIAKGTPISSVPAMIQQAVEQLKEINPGATPTTVYGSLKLF